MSGLRRSFLSVYLNILFFSFCALLFGDGIHRRLCVLQFVCFSFFLLQDPEIAPFWLLFPSYHPVFEMATSNYFVSFFHRKVMPFKTTIISFLFPSYFSSLSTYNLPRYQSFIQIGVLSSNGFKSTLTHSPSSFLFYSSLPEYRCYSAFKLYWHWY